MNKKTKIEFAIHILFWIFCSFFFINYTFIRFNSLSYHIEAYSLLIVVSIIYFNYLYLIPKYFTKQLYIKYFGFLLLGLLIATSVEFLFIKPVIEKLTSDADANFQAYIKYYNYICIFIRDVIFVGFFTMFRIYHDAIKSYKLLQEKINIENAELHTRIDLIKSKVNSHFFFNTLNSIYALALNKSDKTPDIVLNLSDLMEYVVAETENKWVPLENEIKFLQNYISLEKIRHLNMNLEFTSDSNTSFFKVPPMIFESFVNNALKYTNINDNGYIHIRLECKSDDIIFYCKNSINKSNTIHPKSTGKGLINTKNRLNLYYKGKHELDIISSDDNYSVKLLLKSA